MLDVEASWLEELLHGGGFLRRSPLTIGPHNTPGEQNKKKVNTGEPRHVRFEPNIGLESVLFFFHSLQITTSF